MKKLIFPLVLSLLLQTGAFAIGIPGAVTEEKAESVRLIIETEAIPQTCSDSEYSLMSDVSNEAIYEQIKEVSPDVSPIEFTYSVVFNGFSVTASELDIEKIEQLPYVKNVYISRKYDVPDPLLYNAGDIINLPESEAGSDGKGMVIAIVDNEFDTSHSFLNADIDGGRVTENDIEASLASLDLAYDGLTKTDVYKCEKIPFAYDYGENDGVTTASVAIHGTHVAGIAAGKGGTYNGESFNGIAPEAQLMLFKIADASGGMYDDTIIAALDDAVKLDADVINLSIGTVSGFAGGRGLDYKDIIDAAKANGTAVCMAAANSSRIGEETALSDISTNPLAKYPDYGTVAEPSVLGGALSVASALNSKTMSSTSSWGTTDMLTMHPDITAIGGSVLSSIPNGSYRAYGGTSMASPMLAGSMALVLQYVKDTYTDLSADEALLLAEQMAMSTSEVLGSSGIPYSPRQQGSGLINVASAISTPAVITDTDSVASKLELGDNLGNSFTLKFKVRNLSQNALEYNINTTVITDSYNVIDGISFVGNTSRVLESVDEEATLTLSPGETKTVSIDVTLKQSDITELSAHFENGFFAEGFVILTPTDESPVLSIPFLGFYGDWLDAPAFDNTIYEGDSYNNIFRVETIVGSSYHIMGYNRFEENPTYSADDVWISNKYYSRFRIGALRNISTLTAEFAKSGSYLGSVQIHSYLHKYVTGKNNNFSRQATNLLQLSLADGEYDVTFRAYLPYDVLKANPQVKAIKLKIDSTNPEIKSASVRYESGKRILSVTAADNGKLQVIAASHPDGDVQIPVNSTEDTVEFDITGKNISDYTIETMDYALNIASVNMANGYAAYYDADGNMISAENYAVIIKSGTVQLPEISDFPQGADSARLFVWDDNMKPVCDPITISVE